MTLRSPSQTMMAQLIWTSDGSQNAKTVSPISCLSPSILDRPAQAVPTKILLSVDEVSHVEHQVLTDRVCNRQLEFTTRSTEERQSRLNLLAPPCGTLCAKCGSLKLALS